MSCNCNRELAQQPLKCSWSGHQLDTFDAYLAPSEQGAAKVQEAYYIFQELGEKYTWTVLLLNGSAVCQMHMGHFEEAEGRLLEALNKVC
jgi:hypothetical protein